METDTVAFRAHEGAVLPLRTDRVRSVLEVPHRIDESSRPPSAESSQIGRLVSWLALDSEQLAGCDIVLRSAQGLPLLAVSSTEIEGRLAVSALPLDWHRWGDLLANAVRYVALGDPRVLVWGEDDDYEPTIERRSEEHTSELQSRGHLVCRLLLEIKIIIIASTSLYYSIFYFIYIISAIIDKEL